MGMATYLFETVTEAQAQAYDPDKHGLVLNRGADDAIKGRGRDWVEMNQAPKRPRRAKGRRPRQAARVSIRCG